MEDSIDEFLDLLAQGGDVLAGNLAHYPKTLPTVAAQLAGLLSLMTKIAAGMGPSRFSRLIGLAQEVDEDALATALAGLPDPQRERAEGMKALLDRWRGAAEDPDL